jgi:carboxylate-amine ligase
MLASFRTQGHFSLGLEEELMLLDARTLDPAPVAEIVLERLDGDGRYQRELRASQLELITPVAGNACAAGLHLARGRLDVAEIIHPEVLLGASGTHPFSTAWGPVSDDERYRRLADEYVAAVGGNVPCGLHVHVGFAGVDRWLSVYNAVRSYLPEIAALAANSPFAGGEDTGLACARRPLTGAFHRSGVPPAFASWNAFFDLLEWGQKGGVLPDATHLWWDLRPHTRYGTLELRVPDVQTRVEDAIAVAALFQTLVVHLAGQVDRGIELPVHSTVRIEENAWRAMRYGIGGLMVDLDTARVEPTRDRVGRLLERLAPVAEDLGNIDAIHTAHLLMADNGADRQRYVCAERGLYGLTRWIAEETVGSAERFLSRRA